jgi:hypothetical protein
VTIGLMAAAVQYEKLGVCEAVEDAASVLGRGIGSN